MEVYIIEIYDEQETDEPAQESGEGISRCVKTDDSLAVMEEVKIAAMRVRNPETQARGVKATANINSDWK